MNNTVKEFYTSKDKDADYKKNYIIEHSNRHQFIYNRFNLSNTKNKEISEFGVGLGLMFKLFQEGSSINNQYYGFDGANLNKNDLVSQFIQNQCDLDDDLTTNDKPWSNLYKNRFDISFCMETIEHCTSPFRVLNNIKQFTKIDGDIYISIPHESVTHPVIYYQLFYPVEHFVDFLQCMALPIVDYDLFKNGFASWIFKCKNRPWSEKKMHFYKQEEKFKNANLLEVTNL